MVRVVIGSNYMQIRNGASVSKHSGLVFSLLNLCDLKAIKGPNQRTDVSSSQCCSRLRKPFAHRCMASVAPRSFPSRSPGVGTGCLLHHRALPEGWAGMSRPRRGQPVALHPRAHTSRASLGMLMPCILGHPYPMRPWKRSSHVSLDMFVPRIFGQPYPMHPWTCASHVSSDMLILCVLGHAHPKHPWSCSSCASLGTLIPRILVHAHPVHPWTHSPHASFGTFIPCILGHAHPVHPRACCRFLGHPKLGSHKRTRYFSTIIRPADFHFWGEHRAGLARCFQEINELSAPQYLC